MENNETRMAVGQQMSNMSEYYHNRFTGRVTTTSGACDLKAWSRELGGCPVWRSTGL